MASLSEIKMVFRKKFCLTAGIFLFMSLSDISFVQAEDGLRNSKQAGDAAVIEQRILDPVKCRNLENIKITQETIDLKGLKSGINKSRHKSFYRPPVNLKSNISDVSIPAEEKAKTNWIKGKISVLGALSPAIENNQSPELERLKWQSKRRKASFEKSLETMPSRKSQFLQKTAKGDNIKDNE